MIANFTEFKASLNEGFWDWLTGKKEQGSEKQKSPGGQPDIQDLSIESFYETLQDFADSKQSIAVQTYGNMKYSKMVENIQAALSFLGYPLPKYGVDGFFGPETANAILKFNEDTVAKNTQD